MGLLLYDPEGAPEQLFTLADDGNGSAVRIPVLLLPRGSATRLLEVFAGRRLLEGEASPAQENEEEEEEEPLIELEGMEVTVRAEDPDEPLDEPGAQAGTGPNAASPMGTAVRCPPGDSDVASGCIRQHPVDPWSIEDTMWDALRCSTSG